MSQQNSSSTNYPKLGVVESSNPAVRELNRFEPGKLFLNTGVDRALFSQFRGSYVSFSEVDTSPGKMALGQGYMILERQRQGYYTCYLKVISEDGIVGWLYTELHEYGSKLVLVEP